ncbi:MAG: CPBP family intramembrane metalloprotease [Oscillospiraceae bacterium]|jgi:membrane protease YdiL (CAAX protease family)|nr:CPBP family intramembrane metalloprotease [Oscillospiraceae bacterium]
MMTAKKALHPLKYAIALAISPISIALTQVLPQTIGIPTLTEEGFSTWQNALIGTVIALGMLFICLWLAKDKLQEDWPRWKAHWLRNGLIAAGSAVFMLIALSPIAKLLSGLLGNPAEAALSIHAASMLISVPLGLVNIAMGLASLSAPLTEEIIFRHYLVAPFSGKRWMYAVAILLSSAFFALMHIFNVNWNFRALTLYFLLALFLHMIYLIARKNIWQNIFTHLFYNGYIVLLGLMGAVMAMFTEL